MCAIGPETNAVVLYRTKVMVLLKYVYTRIQAYKLNFVFASLAYSKTHFSKVYVCLNFCECVVTQTWYISRFSLVQWSRLSYNIYTLLWQEFQRRVGISMNHTNTDTLTLSHTHTHTLTHTRTYTRHAVIQSAQIQEGTLCHIYLMD